MSEPNRNLGWSDAEATEDRAALDRWYRRQNTQETRLRRLKRLVGFLFLVALDIWLVVWFVRHS